MSSSHRCETLVHCATGDGSVGRKSGKNQVHQKGVEPLTLSSVAFWYFSSSGVFGDCGG